MKLDESAANFKKAVELNPHSGQARLCYGVISIFMYQNAIGEASTPSIRDDQYTPSQEEFDADALRKIRSLPGMEPSSDDNVLVFDRRPGPITIPPFPPDPEQMLVVGLPPPPPWPPPSGVPKQ
jgi:hypothetical protein